MNGDFLIWHKLQSIGLNFFFFLPFFSPCKYLEKKHNYSSFSLLWYLKKNKFFRWTKYSEQMLKHDFHLYVNNMHSYKQLLWKLCLNGPYHLSKFFSNVWWLKMFAFVCRKPLFEDRKNMLTDLYKYLLCPGNNDHFLSIMSIRKGRKLVARVLPLLEKVLICVLTDKGY